MMLYPMIAAFALVAVAPQAAGDATLTYEPNFFAAANPRTALDMVIRVPGFTLDEGDDARGFGGNSGNLLIDGERPSTKSEPLRSILLRIPASGVERLELIRGAAAGLDAAGQAVILNVVRKARPLEGIGELEGRFLDDSARPNGSLALTYRRGPVTVDGQLSIFDQRQTFNAIESRFTPQGSLIERELERVDEPFRNYELQLGFRRKDANGAAFGLRFSGEIFRFRQRVDIDLLDSALLPIEEQLSQFEEQGQEGELTFDYEHPLGSGQSFKLVLLQNLETFSGVSDFREAIGAPEEAFSRFRNDDLSGESVLRATFSLKPAKDVTLETGLEGAYNFLESDAALLEERDGVLVTIPLPSTDVRVAEGRGEAFANANWRIGPKLRLEGGLRVEASTIRQSGDQGLTRFFVFPKPRLLLTWNAREKTQVRLLLERQVGQLDFGAFVTNTSLQDDLTNAGNPELEPDRTWSAEAALEQRWGAQGSATLRLGYDDLQAAPDLVPVLDQFDAPGNLNGGRRLRAALEANIPLDALGLKGAVLETEAFVRDNRIPDPVTGQDRRLSDDRLFQIDATYRHDVATLKTTFSGSVSWFGERESFRLEEIQKRDNNPAEVEVAIEYNGIKNTSVRFAVVNAANATFRRERFLFAGPRDTFPLERIDVRTSRNGPFGVLRVRRVF